MSLILVVEPEARSVERIRDALQADGFSVETVAGTDAALRSVSAQSPGLILVSNELADASSLVQRFSRRAGGPGAIVLLTEQQSGVSAESIGADDVLNKPFTEQQLRLAVRRMFAAARLPHAPPAGLAADSKPLTSQDIFADVLAEVESEVSAAAAKPAPKPPSPPSPPATPPPTATPSRVERALSQALEVEKEKKPAPRAAASSNIDDLLSKTLSGLEVGDRFKRPAAKPAAPAAAAAAPARPAPPPAPPAPDQPTPPTPPSPPAPPPAELPATLPLAETLPLAAAPPPAPAPPAPAAAHGATPAAAPTTVAAAKPTAPPPAPAPAAPVPAAPAPATPAPAAPVAAAPPARPTPPPSPRPAEARPAADRTVGRKATGEIDLAALDELARPKTKAGAAPPKADKSRETGAFATQRIEVAKPAPAKADSREFGQYALLERIALGGMAEVWKARMKGVEGFQKTVAIKKILPHLTDSSDFVTMFIDEAKLAAQLNHNNIIHIYDLGKLGDDYFIAMEFVEGKDLRSILNTARQHNLAMPMGLALLVAARMASALDYAHRKKDFEGRELGLVHRDVSPQNVLISYEGDIKLCDFGIVKAVSKASKTQMGALKGKLQYMSPEQAWGRTVDARSDIFSLGALLFEMLTGRRLFAGDSEMSVLEAVRDCRIQSPRDLDAKIPLEVNGLVLKSLAREPIDRFQSAGEMQKEIEKILYSLKPTPGQADLAGYMHRLFAAEARGPAAEAAPAPARAQPMAQAPAPVGHVAHAPTAAHAPARTEVPAMAPVGEGTAAGTERGSKAGLWVAIAAVVVLGIASAIYFTRGKTPAPPPAEPTAPAETPAGTPPAAGTPEAAPTTAPTTTPPVDVAGMVDQEVRRRQEEAARQKEAEVRRLQTELSRTQTAPPAATSTTATPAPTTRPVEPPPIAAAPPTAVAEPEPAPTPAPPVETPAPAASAPPSEPTPVADAAPPAPSAPTVQLGDLVAPGPGVTPPVLVSISKPEYPPLARRLQVQGVVTVGLLVDENGNVVETRIIKPSSQNVGLNEAAEKAARSAKFKPAMKAGVRVKMWYQLNVPFKM